MTTTRKPRAKRPTYILRFALPFPLRLRRTKYRVAIAGLKCQVTCRRIRQKRFDQRLGIARGQFDLARDRHGFVTFTQLTIHLSMGFVLGYARVPKGTKLTPEVLSSASSAAAELALRIANRFIESYRDVKEEFWIRKIQADQMYRLSIEWPLPRGGREFAEQWTFPGGGLTPPISRASSELDGRLAERLLADAPPPAHRELLLNARDDLDLGDSRSAVVQAYSSIEVGVKQLLRQFFRANDIPLAEVRQVIGGHGATLDDILAWASLDKMLTDGLARALGSPLNPDETPWQEWELCRSIRHLVVHQGIEPTTEKATRAIMAAGRMIADYIDPGLAQIRQIDPVDESWSAIHEILKGNPSRPFRVYLEPMLNKSRLRLSFRSVKFHPTRWQRSQQLTSEEHGDVRLVWIDTSLNHLNKEVLIARLLGYFELLAEDYPRGEVAGRLPFEDYRSAWEHVAHAMTRCVLDLVVDEKLSRLGLNLGALHTESVSIAVRHLLSTSFQPPSQGEARYLVIAFDFVRLYMQANELERRSLMAAFRGAAPDPARLSLAMIQRLTAIGVDTRGRCLEAMVAIHDETMILGSCLVQDPASGQLYGRGGGATLPKA